MLEELSISNQVISAKSLSILGLSLQDNENIHNFSLTSNIILSDFQDFSSSIQTSSLRHLNLSKNQLNDSQGEAICNLIKHSCLSTILLEANQFKTILFEQSINSNVYLEEFSISNNLLEFDAVMNILDILPANRNLKILGLQGYNNILYDKKLAEVLKESTLIVLKYDLDFLDLSVVKSIENTLIRRNKSLVSIESKGIDWDEVANKHPLLQIKRALKANLWLSQNDALPSECNDEIFLDVQDVVIEKQKNCEEFSMEISVDRLNEEETIALEYDSGGNSLLNSQRIDEEILNDVKHSERVDIRETEKSGNGELINALQKMELNFEKIMGKVFERIEAMDEKIEKQGEDVENLKGIISNRLSVVTDNLEKELKNFITKHNLSSNKLEEKVIQIENREDRKTTMLKEIAEQFENIRENYKDLESRIDTLDLGKDSRNNDEHDIKKHREIQILESKYSEILYKIEGLQESNKSLTVKLSRLEGAEDLGRKHAVKIDSLKQEIVSYQTNIDKTVSDLEEKASEFHKLRIQLSSLQKEMSSKFTNIECKFLDYENNSLLASLKSDTSTLGSRLELLEERLSQSLSENTYALRHREQLIESRLAYLEQERLNIEELKTRLSNKSENEGVKESGQHFKPERSLNERIAALEKMNVHKNSIKSKDNEVTEKRYTELREVLPEEAESIVFTSVLEKANKERAKILNPKLQERFKNIRKSAF